MGGSLVGQTVLSSYLRSLSNPGVVLIVTGGRQPSPVLRPHQACCGAQNRAKAPCQAPSLGQPIKQGSHMPARSLSHVSKGTRSLGQATPQTSLE